MNDNTPKTLVGNDINLSTVPDILEKNVATDEAYFFSSFREGRKIDFIVTNISNLPIKISFPYGSAESTIPSTLFGDNTTK
ncbi:MAG TPA: hypothetical protein VN040_23560 [Pseudosphingobacterium sp.]|nr:hypothetical protein [Pseudosphingobacterium sp.]